MEKMSRVAVKILGISATPVKGGNCDILVKEALQAANEVGKVIGDEVQIEFVTLADKKITMCRHCQWCIEHRQPCKIKDDAIWIWEKVIESDGLILGAPTWSFNVCPLVTILASRMRYWGFFTRQLHNKVVGCITLGFFGWGLEQALDQMENMTKPVMLPVARGWAITSTAAFGQRPEYLEHGVLDDKAGIHRARLVGIRVVEVARMIKYATTAGITLPNEYALTVTGGRWDDTREKEWVRGVWRDKDKPFRKSTSEVGDK